MNRKKYIFTTCIAVAIIVGTFTYIFVGTSKTKALMWEYLNSEGYIQTDIQRIAVSHSFFNRILSYDEWELSVIF